MAAAYEPEFDLTGQGHRVLYGSSYPTAASDGLGVPWSVGDRIINIAPTIGSPWAWRCTTAGVTGTWEPMVGGGPIANSTRATTTGILSTDGFVNINTAGGAVANALPLATSFSGKMLYLKRVGGSAATFTATAIDGGATLTLGSDGAAAIVYSNGLQWYVLASFGTVSIS